jgi:phage tail sheath protein FI
MANLVSPGTQVQITDESVYGSAGAGTVPMIFIATGQDKVDPTSTETDGIAKYTKSAVSGSPILVTSQRELTQYFGNVDFRTVSGTVQQGDETNDYGLLAAYSFLGQASAAYIVRADVDLTALRPATVEPVGAAANNTYWVNPTLSKFGIFENTASGWTTVTPNVEIVSIEGNPPTTAVVNGDYLVTIEEVATYTHVHYYIGEGGVWVALDSAWATGAATLAPHYSAPVGASVGDVWIKTTTPGAGIDYDISLFTTTSGSFVAQTVMYVQASAPTGVVGDTFQDGTAATSRLLTEGDIWFDVDDGFVSIHRYNSTTLAFEAVISSVQTTAPVGTPLTDTLWFDTAVNELAIFEVAIDGGVQKWKKATNVTYTSSAPVVGADGDYWVDTDEADYPVIYRSNGSAWVVKDNTDQSTSDGVVFGDISDLDVAGGDYVLSADVLAGGPSPLLYAEGTSAVNMCRSKNTVRKYDTTLTTAWKWRNFASNAATGAGSFGRLAQRKVVSSAMQASTSSSTLREETVQFRLIAAPGYPELMDEMVTLNTDRNETAFVIADSPFRKNPTEAIAWVQGTDAAENGEDGLVSKSTYAAAYYPSVLTTDPVSGASVVAPASHSVLYTYAYSDNVSYQWFAPAGLTRGVVQNASNVGYINSENEFVPVSLTQGHQESMYLNKLNPIVNLPAEGIVIFGQKTLAAGASALDRVNVARLVAYLRERFAVISRPYLFEPNDESVRANIDQTFSGFITNIQTNRGVYDFSVVCDTTNNTPARIDRNEIYVDIAIEPTKSGEFIYIPVRIVNTGELS